MVAYCTESGSLPCTVVAQRSNSQPLFPSPSEGKKYYLRVEVNQSLDASVDPDVRLEWNKTDSLLSMVVSFFFLSFVIYLLVVSSSAQFSF